MERNCWRNKCWLIVLSILLLVAGYAETAYSQSIQSTGSSTTSSELGVFKLGDPVWVRDRKMYIFETLFDLGGPLPVRYLYNGNLDIAPIIEYGGETEGTEAMVRYFGADKGAFKMSKSGGVWVDNPYNPKVYVLKESDWYFYLMDPVDELVYIFYKPNGGTTRQRCHLKYLIDRNGNTLTYSGAFGTQQMYYTKLEDGLGRVINIAGNDYSSATITDQAGRSYSRVVSTSGGRRTTIVDPMGNATIYWMGTDSWNTGDIRKIEKPLHNVPVTNTFEQWEGGGKVAVKTQTDAYGNVTTMNGITSGSAITATAPDGSVKTYHFDGYNSSPSSITDEANKEATFNTITRGGISGITDRMGGKTSMDYHVQTGKIASITNANNKTITNTYTAQDQTFTNPANSETATFTFYNLTRVNYPDGTNEPFTYDAKGNMLTRRDQTGKIWTYTYNGKGQVLTATNPSGGVATNTYNNDGTLASTKDSDTGITTYTYDVYKRPITVTLPGGATIQTGYSLNDQITSITDENNNTYTFTYDANGNLTNIKDPLNNNTQYAYDLMDRVSQLTDRLNKTTTMAYNNMGRLQTITDPNNLATSYSYEARGWVTSTTIGGQTWQTSYNDEGIPATNTTPMNWTTTYISNNLGLLASVTNPLNQTTTLTWDSMLRKTGVTDALGRTTAFAYNQRGLLSGVTLPVVGASAYTYNNSGLLSNITDLKGSNWTFGYTTMGRLKSLTDPLGNTWQRSYDTRGRLTGMTFPDGGTETRTLDNAGNVTRKQYSDNTDIQYTYDALNRLITANNVALAYDAEGRVTSTDNPGTVFGAAYNDGGRLTTATYNNGLFAVTYTYNATTGLLSGVTDNLTGTNIGFTYNNDNQLTGVTRPNGVNALLTHDGAGRVTRIQDGSVLDLQYTLNAAGQVTGLDMTAPLNPADLIQGSTDVFTYNATSEVNTAGYKYDRQGRLTAAPSSTFTWNDASRLTKIGSTTLTYNGLNDLVTRTEGGTTTHYYYNKAIGLGPIVAEKNDTTGNFLRYYVWTPGGQLLYMIDAASSNKVYFYHFDRLGSTLALTNSVGAVTDAYAYTPYGKVLQHSGSNPQPFTFVGKWGIRKEGSGDLYQMRVRYYDAKTARFISREPVWPIIDDPLQLNPYQYAALDPVGMFDLTGMPAPKNDLWKYKNRQWEPINPANPSNPSGETTDRYDPSGFGDNYNPTSPQDSGFGGNTGCINKRPARGTFELFGIYDLTGNLEIMGKVTGTGGAGTTGGGSTGGGSSERSLRALAQRLYLTSVAREYFEKHGIPITDVDLARYVTDLECSPK